jgi:aryl-alcohol dehydrogenase-like predicted oxidoreductase
MKLTAMLKKKITRRKFVSTVTLGAGIVAFGKAFPAHGLLPQEGTADPLQKVTLGKSGIRTTLLGMGTGFNGYNRTSAITRAGTAETVIRHAYDSGIRFFDCADTYGTHPFVAKTLKGISRDSYTLSSKIWVAEGGIPETERPGADIVVDRFRKELETDYIDMIQIHCMTSTGWTDEYKKQMDILENLKVKGIIRAHGVSVHSLEAMETAAESPWVDVVHVRINPFGVAMDSKDPEKVIPVIKKLHSSGKGVIGMKLIGNGSFSNDSDKINHSIRYVLGLGTVDMIIAGFEKPEQIDNYILRIESALKIIRAEN